MLAIIITGMLARWTVNFIIVNAEALPILCVRYFRWERERLIPKTIGNRKRDCAWDCAWGINTTWENLQIEKHKSVRWAERTPSWFVLFDLQIFSGGVYSQAQPHAQSLFLFPIVFGINLILFSIFSARKKNGAAGNSIVCFAASIPCQSRHLTARKMRTVSKSATFLATESVNSAPIKGGETEVQTFWQGKAQNSSPILRCTFLARRSAKLIANFSATMVTSLPSFSLCISLSLSHRMYLTHNIGNASAFPIIQRERERKTEVTSPFSR